MKAAEELSPKVGVVSACESLGVPRVSFCRWRCSRGSRKSSENAPRRPSHRALSEDERQTVLSVLHEGSFVDLAPAQVYARLLDEGTFLCSIRTMYRILEAEGEGRERRNQPRHPQYVKPELVATGPGRIWTWDITKLLRSVEWSYYYLYVILDMYSRYTVGWMLANRESAALASGLIGESCRWQGIREEELTLHSDRGASMT
ncbi:MAG: DDE-type integrase/transposase/recombinase [Candidatus Eisenbacteria sp.]|nr:DDE-type integrase/transposase/recombinase [Candidatus Eisenbacteria bacterium]